MVDLIGPGDAGASPTLTTTSDVTAPLAGDTWFNDCPAGVADASATPIVSKWLNRFMQQFRKAIRFSGVPIASSYDNMLSWAIQSGYANWVGSFAGTANALTGAAPNAPIQVEGGTVVCGIVGTATNTGAVTFDWAGLGAQPVLTNLGAALVGGELVHNSFLVVRWDGAAWRIVSPTADVSPPPPDANPYTRTDVGAIVIGGNYGTFSSGIANAIVSIGDSGTFVDGFGIAGTRETCFVKAGGPSVPSAIVSDDRWTSIPPAIPGTWRVQSYGIVGPILGGAGDQAKSIAFLRTA